MSSAEQIVSMAVMLFSCFIQRERVSLIKSMKTTRTYIDLGTIFDELFSAASQIHSEFEKKFHCPGGFSGGFIFDENTDYYPGFSYPPMNVFLTEDKSLTFEFALAGFDEKNISLSFQGDYMIFSARIGDVYSGESAGAEAPNVHYLKRRLKLKDIDRQKYYVPLDKYDQEKVRAVFRNGILRVTIPPRAENDRAQSVSIAIIKEGS